MDVKVPEKVSVPLVVGVVAASLLIPSASLSGLLSLAKKRSFAAGLLTAAAVQSNKQVTVE